jgi:hypothetical protein
MQKKNVIHSLLLQKVGSDRVDAGHSGSSGGGGFERVRVWWHKSRRGSLVLGLMEQLLTCRRLLAQIAN